MVRVDGGILDLEKIHYHLSGGRQALVEDVLHHVADLALQLVVVGQLRQVDIDDDLAQLFIDLVRAVERRLEKPGDLLSHEDLKGTLRHK